MMESRPGSISAIVTESIKILALSFPFRKNMRSRECEEIHTTNSQEWEEEKDAEPQYYVEDDWVVLRIGLGAAQNLRLKQKIWCNEQVEAMPETYKFQSCFYISALNSLTILYVSWYFANG